MEDINRTSMIGTYVFRVLLFAVMVVGIGTIAVFIPDFGNKGNMLYSILDKHDRMDSIQGPKIIFAGGSNLAFGLDSRMVEEAFDKPVVNMGIHAGLGLKFILDDVRPYISEGDVVVIVPEYPHFYKQYPSTFYGQDELLTMVFDIVPNERKYISFKQWTHLYRGLPNYIGNKYYCLLKYGRKPRVATGRAKAYQRNSFNEYGDIITHLDMEPYKVAGIKEVDYPANLEVIEFINEFGRECKAKGAKVVMAMTSIQDTGYYKAQSHIDDLTVAFENYLEVPLIAAPARYRFKNELFFDTMEHLNKEGREMRTQMLIEDISAYMK
ncbi:MAG: hypothetical protein MRZ79_24530 [Bacteroidia bacterium]|nr:hypothetical protein [Bacteroidia bacterium]